MSSGGGAPSHSMSALPAWPWLARSCLCALWPWPLLRHLSNWDAFSLLRRFCTLKPCEVAPPSKQAAPVRHPPPSPQRASSLRMLLDSGVRAACRSPGRLRSPVEGQLEGHLNKGVGAALLLFDERFPVVVKLINHEVEILYYSVEKREDV